MEEKQTIYYLQELCLIHSKYDKKNKIISLDMKQSYCYYKNKYFKYIVNEYVTKLKINLCSILCMFLCSKHYCYTHHKIDTKDIDYLERCKF